MRLRNTTALTRTTPISRYHQSTASHICSAHLRGNASQDPATIGMGRKGKRPHTPPHATLVSSGKKACQLSPYPHSQATRKNQSNLSDTSGSNKMSLSLSDDTDDETKSRQHQPKIITTTRSNHSISNSHASSKPTPPDQEKIVKIPPIFLAGTDWRKVAGKLLSTLPADSLQAKAHDSTTVKILSMDTDVYRIVQEYFRTTNTPFHTHPLQEDRTLKIVIKGLLSDTTESEVEEDLKSKGYEVKFVRQFGNATKKLPIHMVSLISNPTNKLIFRETTMLFMSIKIESYRSNTPAQCFACQRFGHSSLHCGYSPRCVKCAGPHLAKDCLKTKEEEPKCINCEGNHTANYSKCPALIQEKASRRPIRPNTINQTTTIFPVLPPTTSQTQFLTSKPTYASKTASGTSNNSSAILSLTNQLTELIPQITSGKTEIKDALILVLTILPLLLPLLLNHHG